MNLKKAAIISFLLAFAVALYFSLSFYSKIFKNNVKEKVSVYIPTEATFEEVITELSPYIENIDNFKWVAHKKNYPNLIKSGHYILNKGMNNNELVNLLRSGAQTPIKIAFNNQDTLEKLAGRIAEQIEADSTVILNSVLDKNFLEKNSFTKASVLGMFVPNSYEFYWNTSAEKFRDKMLNEYNRFWNQDRQSKAKKLNLTRQEVSTLASIVQKETSQISERPIVAGLYLNRIRQGWPLGADPTIIYILKQKYGQDYVVKRVLYKDLEIDSPYNTYKNVGLPPTLIAMPDISSIDAVLADKRHDYYFMCVDVDKLGFHAFAKTQEQHNINAAKYHRWVNNQGIKR